MQARADGFSALWRTARTLSLRAAAGKARRRLPALFFFTDPQRTPDPVATAARLPRGAAVVYRSFGRDDAVPVGLALARVARARGLVFLVGADDRLARRLRADGLHLPERLLYRGPALRRANPAWLLTGAGHGEAALRRARLAGVDAAVLSPVFTSRSRSAGAALGPVRFAALVRRARLPVVALGGVNGRTAPRLLASGAAALAAVDGVHEVRGRP